MWNQDWDTGFYYKRMACHNSCVPCCLDVIVKNLQPEEPDVTGQSMEEMWKEEIRTRYGKNLEENNPSHAPSEDEIRELLELTPVLKSNTYNVSVPPKFDTPQTAIPYLNAFLKNKFLDNHSPSGLLFGINHACVLFKLRSGKYAYLCPDPKKDYLDLRFFNKLEAKGEESADKTEFRINFLGDGIAPDGGLGLFNYGNFFIHIEKNNQKPCKMI